MHTSTFYQWFMVAGGLTKKKTRKMKYICNRKNMRAAYKIKINVILRAVIKNRKCSLNI